MGMLARAVFGGEADVPIGALDGPSQLTGGSGSGSTWLWGRARETGLQVWVSLRACALGLCQGLEVGAPKGKSAGRYEQICTFKNHNEATRRTEA